jgi:hypothetical protein
MIAQSEPKLVAGFRDSPRDVYRLVDEDGAAKVCQAGFTDVVDVKTALAVNLFLIKEPRTKPDPGLVSRYEFMSPAADMVVRWMRNNPTSHTVAEISKKCFIIPSFVKSALSDLVDDGLVEQVEPLSCGTKQWQAR